MQVSAKKLDGKAAGKVELDDAIFGIAEIRGDTLILRSKNSGWNLFRISSAARFDVQVRDLRALHLLGSGEVEVGNFIVDDLKIKRTGSGQTNLAILEADSVDITTSGSGDLSLESLLAENVDLQLSGSSNMRVKRLKLTDDLDLKISGSGEIAFDELFAEALHAKISGSGNIRVDDGGEVEFFDLGADFFGIFVGDGGFGEVGFAVEPADVDVFGVVADGVLAGGFIWKLSLERGARDVPSGTVRGEGEEVIVVLA